MKPPHFILGLLLALIAFAAQAAHAQTIRALSYDTTNFAALTWTNTNALTLSNRLNIQPALGGTTNILAFRISVSNNETGAYVSDSAGNGLVFVHNGTISLGLLTNSVTFYRPTLWSGTNATTSRSNLFGGAVGITTNISVVGTNNTNTLQFLNGLLTNVTSP
jgi:hypothetical protein